MNLLFPLSGRNFMSGTVACGDVRRSATAPPPKTATLPGGSRPGPVAVADSHRGDPEKDLFLPGHGHGDPKTIVFCPGEFRPAGNRFARTRPWLPETTFLPGRLRPSPKRSFWPDTAVAWQKTVIFIKNGHFCPFSLLMPESQLQTHNSLTYGLKRTPKTLGPIIHAWRRHGRRLPQP